MGECFQFFVEYLTQVLSVDVPLIGEDDERVSEKKKGVLLDALRGCLFRSRECYLRVDKSQSLHAFDGKKFQSVPDSFLANAVSKSLERIHAGVVYRIKVPDELAKVLLREILVEPQCRFEPNRRYVAFDNCVLDLKEDRTREFSAEFVTDICLDIDYDPTKRSELWTRFIQQTFPVAGFRDVFQWFCGAFLIDRREYKIEYACFVVGPGSNGKSVAVDSVCNVFGNGLIAKFSPKQLFGDKGNVQQNLAALEGKLANVTDDIDKSLLSGGDFKTFVSGGEFQARLLYKEPFIVRAPFMLCCTNEMPPTADDTEGHHRRILPVKSTDHVYRGSERDTGLTGKLSTKESRQAIFNWIYEGYRRVVSDSGNLEIPECVEALRNSVKENSNTVRRWLFEMRYVPESPDEITAAGSWHETNKLYEAYKKYCQEEGAMEKNTKTRSGFRDALTVIGFVSRKRAIGWVTYLKVTPEEDYGEEIIGELVKEDNGLPF